MSVSTQIRQRGNNVFTSPFRNINQLSSTLVIDQINQAYNLYDQAQRTADNSTDYYQLII